MENRWLSVDEIAAYLGTSAASCIRGRKAGQGREQTKTLQQEKEGIDDE